MTRHQRKAANKAAWASASAAAAGDLAVRDAIWKRRSASLESADQQAAVAAPPPDFFATRRRRLVAYIAERKAELTKPGHVPYRTQKERGLARAEMELASLPSAAHG